VNASDRERALAIVEQHFAAENAHDIPATLATYADDLVWDDVSNPDCPVQGKEAAAANYADILATIPDLTMVSTLRFASGEHVVDEAVLSGHVRGFYLGIEADGAPVSFRILHVFDIRDGLISREQAWFDTAGVMGQIEAYLRERRGASPGSP
jgi:steroid delta-isomerase-like uncharacterized protein